MKLLIPIIYLLITFSSCSTSKYGPSKIWLVNPSHLTASENHRSDSRIPTLLFSDFKEITYTEISKDTVCPKITKRVPSQKLLKITPSSSKINHVNEGSVTNKKVSAIRDEGDEEPKTNSMAIAAIIFGILGFILFPFAIAAIVFGKIAEQQVATSREKGLELAKTAVTLGYIGLVVFIIALILGLLFILLALSLIF